MKTQVLHHHLQDVQFDTSNWREANKTLVKSIFCLKILFDININAHESTL